MNNPLVPVQESIRDSEITNEANGSDNVDLRERVGNVEKETLVNDSALDFPCQVRVKMLLERVHRIFNVLKTAGSQQDTKGRLVQNRLEVTDRASRSKPRVHDSKVCLSAIFLNHKSKRG
jgi:hypothetical protein